MHVDPDGHWIWLAINAGFAAYDGYKAYKAGKSKKQIAWAVASNFLKVKYIKGASRLLKATKSTKYINGTRGTGVRRGWAAERAMIAKYGQGSRKWSGKRRAEILRMGKAKGFIGHHINSVKNHPEWAGLAKNIRFVTPKQHYRLHGGNWKNKTTGKFIKRRR
ncbi:hypothetical protein [Priestia megaterium]|uniref:hypothetical protein n=1 Tax=Priestia megaterium TaxID=1404 RepID=UPI001C52A52D|nr:hypothetical protein [Priestia megaterium]